MLFIGVDPGRHGAIAGISATRDIVMLANLPWLEDGRHDPHTLTALLDDLPEQQFFQCLKTARSEFRTLGR